MADAPTEINMMDIAEYQGLAEKLVASLKYWVFDYFLEPNTLYVAGIIVGCVITAFFASRLVIPYAEKRIAKLDLPYRARKVTANVVKLLSPLFAVIFLVIAARIAAIEALGVDVALIKVLVKVILAWIGIRMIVQFIDNNAIRNAFAMFIWIVAALSIFGVLDSVTASLSAFGFMIGDFRLSALVVIKGGFYIFALIYFASFLSSLAERRLQKSKSMTRSSQVLLSKVIRIILIGIALMIAITSAGIDLSLFAVFGGAIGLGIGFGLQKGISNLFSGMLLLTDKSIKPGDVIELENGTFGWVNRMAARYTEIVSRDNKSFLIPNEEFITQRVINWSHGNDYIRIAVPFGVSYNEDPHNVMKLAIAAATKPERVVNYRAPVCWITGFGDSSVDFTLRFWIKDAQNGLANVKGEVYLALWDAFKEHNINIPYPHREVFVHEVKTPTA